MPQPANSNLKLNKPVGRIPTLQFCRPAELRIDPSYQRDINGGASQALIRRIAQQWNWDLCQPLVVARRQDITERLFVIDGQHRLEAARLRGDIDQLPCVIVNYASPADEAAGFVSLNQQRKPLSRIDLFKAAVLSSTGVAPAISEAIEDAGLVLTGMADAKLWRPGMINNIGGIERAWLRHGAAVTRQALKALARGFQGQVLTYGGTMFPGIVAICAAEMPKGNAFEPQRFERLVNMLSLRAQNDWRRDIMNLRVEDPNLKFAAASARAFLVAWERARGGVVPAPPRPIAAISSAPKPASVAAPKAAIGAEALAPRWCDQCEQRKSAVAAMQCQSRFCALKKRA